MKTTKKELTEKIARLEQQIQDARNERKQMFNKYTFLNDLEKEITFSIESKEITDEDGIQKRISEEIDNACIYYKTCFEIAMELNATDFSVFDMGNPENISQNISQLAYFALDEYVREEIQMNKLTDLIDTIATTENRK